METAVQITLIICITVIALVWLGNSKGGGK